MNDNLLQVCSFGVNFYVLRDGNGLYLIYGGFIAGYAHLLARLRERGWNKETIIGIIITHGHLDHILNVKRIAEKHGAWIVSVLWGATSQWRHSE